MESAVNDDLRVSIPGQTPIDPIEDVKAVEPPHTHVVALALAAHAQIGHEHVEVSIIVVPSHVQHVVTLTDVAIAVDNERPAVVGGVRGVERRSLIEQGWVDG